MSSPIIAINSAKDLREELGLNDEEVINDIISLITDTAGYEYDEDWYNEPFYGCSEYKGSGLFKISYNLNFDWNLPFKRFTLAHELGHISMHHQYLREHILHRCYTNEQFIKQMEIEADCFAANFLAPSNACSNLIKFKEFSPDTIYLIASHFNISTYAAALRFIELTEITCSFIVCNKNGRSEYERRSLSMGMCFNHPFVHKSKIHPHTLTYDFINGKTDAVCCETDMSYWYPEMSKDAKVRECVIDLGYNEKIMTLLTPEFSDYEAFSSEDTETKGKYTNT